MMVDYVLGFCVNSIVAHEYVLLIEKTKKDWQHGLVNGIGGKVEQEESLHEAMVREFYEETGLDSSEFGWRMFCGLSDRVNWRVYCFVGRGDVSKAKDCDEGRMIRAYPNHLPENAIDNLRWLVPMALAKSPVFATVSELS